jgi:hypothetical protein
VAVPAGAAGDDDDDYEEGWRSPERFAGAIAMSFAENLASGPDGHLRQASGGVTWLSFD